MSQSQGSPFKILDNANQVAPQKTYKGLTVLLVDDTQTLRAILRSIFFPYGVEILEAGDGVEATKILETQPKIDLIFCDINMPRMDGLTFLENMRQRTDEKKSCPLVIVSTESEKALIDRAMAAGISGWAIKPPVKAKITQLIERILDPIYNATKK